MYRNTRCSLPKLWSDKGSFSPSWRVEHLLKNILDLLYAAERFEDFAPSGKPNVGTSRDGRHRIRLFHDELLLDYWKNRCVGTIYRSEGVLRHHSDLLDAGSGLEETHGEHVIPIRVIAYLLWWKSKSTRLDIEGLCKFILEWTCVCLITKNEEKLLRTRRSILNQESGWVRSHPFVVSDASHSSVFLDITGTQCDKGDVPIFGRYIGVPIKVFLLDGIEPKKVDFECFSVADHFAIVSQCYGIAR